METSRLTSKGQTTIPQRIRRAAHMHEGDVLSFSVDVRGRVVIERVVPQVDGELPAMESSLTEWEGAEDERAWAHL